MKKQKNSIYIIAEAGVNHNGSLETAFKLVDAAVDAGANAVKFQSFKAEKLVTLQAKKADYQEKNQSDGKTQLQMLKTLELSESEQIKLYNYCQKLSIDFLSSPFDPESCSFLINRLKLKTVKLGSGELTNAQMLYQIAQADVNIILSTGMSTLEEIAQALSILAYGYLNNSPPHSSKDFKSYWKTSQGLEQLKKHVTLMHCTTEYPCPIDEVNLSAIQSIKTEFSLDCGYSDHTKGIHISIAAAALGAPIIEKHFTLDCSQPGPDHKASIEPHELFNLVKKIRDVELAQGSGIKQVTKTEFKNIKVARKGIYAAVSIKQGEILTADKLILKRPLCQHSALDFWDIVGKSASKDYTEDSPI